jgi:hypothetical protein
MAAKPQSAPPQVRVKLPLSQFGNARLQSSPAFVDLLFR